MGPSLVPYLRDPRFAGRDRELAELHELVSKGSPVVVRAARDMGPGGAGVTHLVIEYVHRHRDDHAGGVYWAGPAWDWWSRRQIATSLDVLAHRAGLPVAPVSSHARTPSNVELAAHLAERRDALLVMEDIDEPGEVTQLRGRASSPFPCPTILLSRRRSVDLRFPHLDVGLLDEQEALALLRAGDARRDAALPLVRMLGRLPLALALASAHLEARPGLSLDAYLERLVALGAPTLPDGDPLLCLAERHGAAARAVIAASWEELPAAARRALAVIALHGPGEHVPLPRLGMLAGEDAGACSALVRAGLVTEMADGLVRAHPLVRAFALAAIDDLDALACACAARFAGALLDPERLEREVDAHGLREVAADLHLGRTICHARAEARGADISFHELLCLLEEIGSTAWTRVHVPGLVMQHFRRYFRRDPEKVARADAALAARRIAHLREEVAPDRVLGNTASAIVSLAVTADGQRAITVARDASLTSWELPSGRAIHTIRVAEAPFLVAPEISARGLVCLVSPHRGGPLSLWDLTSGRVAMTLDDLGEEQVLALALSRSGRFAAAGTHHGALRVWDLARPEPPRVTSLEAGRTFDHERRGLAVTDDGRAALVGTGDGALIIERRDGTRVERAAHVGGVTGLAVTPDDRRVMTGGDDGAIKLWDIDSAALLATFDLHPMPSPPRPRARHPRDFPRAVRGVALTEDGRFAVVVTEARVHGQQDADSSLTIWDLGAGRVVQKLAKARTNHGEQHCCAVSPDASLIVLSGSGGPVVVRWVRWDEP